MKIFDARNMFYRYVYVATKIIFISTYTRGVEGRRSQHSLWQKLAISPEQRVDFVTEDC